MARTEYRWYAVITPSVFSECRLPENDEDMTASDWRAYRKLESLAESHGTYVQSSTYRRG